MRIFLGLLLCGVTLTFPVITVFSQEIIIGIGQQGNETLKQNLPSRGLSQEQVSEQYGEPVNRVGPTGNPPIETWHYDYFSVYFEGDTVIHSVIKHVRQDQITETTP